MATEEYPYLAASTGATTSSAGTPYFENGRAVPVGHGGRWIVTGWHLFRRQPMPWLLLAIVFGFIFFAISVVPVLGQIAATLLLPVFGAGMMRACHRVDSGEELELADLFWGFRHQAGPLVMVGVISAVLVAGILVASMVLTGAGSALTQLAGGSSEAVISVIVGLLVFFALVIPVYMAMWFAPALIVFRQSTPPRAMMQSLRGCLRNIVPFLVYGLMLMVLGMFAAIPFGLGWLVLGPVMAGSVYAGYRDIYAQR